jgi:hypothetical protein
LPTNTASGSAEPGLQGKTLRIVALDAVCRPNMALIVGGATERTHGVVVINDEHRGSALWASFMSFGSGG